MLEIDSSLARSEVERQGRDYSFIQEAYDGSLDQDGRKSVED